MTRNAMLFGFALTALLPMSAMADDQMVIKQGDSIEWKPAPPAYPKGAQIAILYGDPSKEGPFALRMKFPAGYKVPPHFHPADENVTVLSGTLYIGMGDQLDEKKAQPLKAGGVMLMPKGMHHYGWASEETVLQGNGVGPTGITYVNEKDDPRKTN